MIFASLLHRHGYRYARNLSVTLDVVGMPADTERRQHRQSDNRSSQKVKGILHRHLCHSPLLRRVSSHRLTLVSRLIAASNFAGTLLQAHVSAAKAAIDALFRVAAGSLSIYSIVPERRLKYSQQLNMVLSVSASISSRLDRSAEQKAWIDS